MCFGSIFSPFPFQVLFSGEPAVTLPETNIASENGCLEYYFPIGFRPIFRGEPLVSGRVVFGGVIGNQLMISTFHSSQWSLALCFQLFTATRQLIAMRRFHVLRRHGFLGLKEGVNTFSSWWFQPIWEIVGQIGSFPQVGVEIKHV